MLPRVPGAVNVASSIKTIGAQHWAEQVYVFHLLVKTLYENYNRDRTRRIEVFVCDRIETNISINEDNLIDLFRFSFASYVKNSKMNVHVAMFYNVRMNVYELYVKNLCSIMQKIILLYQRLFHVHKQILPFHQLFLHLHLHLFQLRTIFN